MGDAGVEVEEDLIEKYNLQKNQNTVEIDKIKEIAKKHRNLYTLKKEGKI